MDPPKKAAQHAAILLALVLLAILAGIFIAATGMPADGAVGPDPAGAWRIPEPVAATAS